MAQGFTATCTPRHKSWRGRWTGGTRDYVRDGLIVGSPKTDHPVVGSDPGLDST
jgi:hypothetical protein